MSHLEDLVDKVTKFFCRRLPNAREGGPFAKTKIASMFEEAGHCYKLLAEDTDLPPVYRPVIDELVVQWPLYDAPRLLYLALADNIRVNREHLAFARGEHDSIHKHQDLELHLCDFQRNELREAFLEISNVAKQTTSWARFKAYVLLVDLHEKFQRFPAYRFSEELTRISMKPAGVDKLVASLTLENISDDLRTTQAAVSRTLNRELKLEQIKSCDVDILALAIEARPEVANTVVRLVSENIEHSCDVETIEDIAKFLANILTSKNFTNQASFLNRLDLIFGQGSFAQSELLNFLFVFLKQNHPKCIKD